MKLLIRLLAITNNPRHASFRQRIGIHLDLLREAGIACEVVKLPGGLGARRALFASARDFDGILLHRKILNTWDGFWMRRYGGRVIFDFDDAIMYSDRKPEQVSRIRMRRFGRSTALSCAVIAGNRYLADHARRYNANVHILPTALDVRAYDKKCPHSGDQGVRLVWIGSDSTLKYLHELRPALEEIGKRFPHTILRIVCNRFLDLEAMPVEKCTWSTETEAADLMTSDIGLAPLPDNRFTRGKCGFKILQYQAAGLPVVASPVGVNGDFVQNGKTGFLARNHSEWVETLAMLIGNPEMRGAFGRSGRSEVERFDARVIGRDFCRLITESLEPGSD
ncbi:MAG: glycosyltransferase family 4 protein [Planctomycetota bacterium]|nr:glycosyltransferase family 4 protein [Planctomycetota bacterium]